MKKNMYIYVQKGLYYVPSFDVRCLRGGGGACVQSSALRSVSLISTSNELAVGSQ